MMYVSANEKAVSLNLHRYNAAEAEERRRNVGRLREGTAGTVYTL
jgi:hypothetical protein